MWVCLGAFFVVLAINVAFAAFVWWTSGLDASRPELTSQQRRRVRLENFHYYDAYARQLKTAYNRKSEEICRYKEGIRKLPWFLCPEILRRRFLLEQLRSERGEIWEEYDIISSLRDCYRREIEYDPLPA